MVNITIRNLPLELLKRMRIFAARSRRSLNSEMLIILEEGVSSRISTEICTGSNSFGSLVLQKTSPISSGLREKIWSELCGSWTEERTLSEVISEIYTLRENGKIS